MPHLTPAQARPDILADLRAAFERSGGSHPTFIDDMLFERARANGFDMRGYITSLPVPRMSGVHFPGRDPNVGEII